MPSTDFASVVYSGASPSLVTHLEELTAMKLRPAEPEAGPWRVEKFDALVARLLSPTRWPTVSRPIIIAIDGPGGAGKTTLASRMAAGVPASVVVHTDDIAWHHSFFDWTELLRESVLEPLWRGEPVHYRPPGWVDHRRPGAIRVPARSEVVWVEGTGASRRELEDLIDASVWVQADEVESHRRLLERDGHDGEALRAAWEKEERTFLANDRPWTRATAIVAGTAALDHDPVAEIVTAEPLRPPQKDGQGSMLLR